MIQERQFLNFIPPKLDGDNTQNKRRYMIVAKNDSNNTIDMINISKISDRNIRNLIKDYNVILKDYKPLKLPSFAKTNTIYRIKYFDELNNFISFGGEKLNKNDFSNILIERDNEIRKNKKEKVIFFTKEEFLNKNPIEVNIN